MCKMKSIYIYIGGNGQPAAKYLIKIWYSNYINYKMDTTMVILSIKARSEHYIGSN
jgi:hypothetical protein